MAMLLPFLALDLLLSVMTDSIKAIHALLADELLSGNKKHRARLGSDAVSGRRADELLLQLASFLHLFLPPSSPNVLWELTTLSACLLVCLIILLPFHSIAQTRVCAVRY